MSEVQESTALAILPRSMISTVLAADENDILGALARELSGFVGDVTSEKGRREIASKARKVAVAKMDLVRLGDALKEGAQKTIKSVNAELRTIQDRMDGLRDQVRAPLDEYEAAEERRIAEHIAALQAIADTTVFGLPEPTAVEIESRLTVLQGVADREWQEFGTKAAQAHQAAYDRLTDLSAAAVVREAERAETAKLRAEADERARQDRIREQAAHEARIAAQAAEQARMAEEQRQARLAQAEAERVADEAARVEREHQARLAAEAAERQRVELAARRAQERADAAERQAAEAARQAEANRIAAAAQAERDRQAAVEAERAAIAEQTRRDQAEADRRAPHRAPRQGNHRAAAAARGAAGRTRANAEAAITAIAQGSVPRVAISY